MLVSDTETARRLNKHCGFWCVRLRWPEETKGKYLTADLSRMPLAVPIPACLSEVWLVVATAPDAQHWIQLCCMRPGMHDGSCRDIVRKMDFGPDQNWVIMVQSISGGYNVGGRWYDYPNPGELFAVSEWDANRMDHAGLGLKCEIRTSPFRYHRPCAQRETAGLSVN